jgi:hypothetical protein
MATPERRSSFASFDHGRESLALANHSLTRIARNRESFSLTDHRFIACIRHTPYIPVAKNMQKPGAFRQTIQAFRFD